MPDAVRDVDFSPAHHNRVLATTCEDGSCVLWEWSTRRRLTTLQLPAGIVPPAVMPGMPWWRLRTLPLACLNLAAARAEVSVRQTGCMEAKEFLPLGLWSCLKQPIS